MNNYFDLINFDSYDNEIVGLTDELKVQYILNQQQNTKRNQILVTNSLYEANMFYRRFKSYTDKVMLFPMDDFLTSEALAISPELKLTRLNVLNESYNNELKIIVTNLMGILRFLPDPQVYLDSFINLKVNENINQNQLIEKLFNMGYVRQSIVTKTGDIAPRGYVIDIFSIQYNDPVRIEFWGDTIESIRIFDINSQRTIKNISEIKIYPNTESIGTNGLIINHRDIINQKNITNLFGYFNEAQLYINNLNQIEISYNFLQEEILNYCISENIDSNTKFMHDLSIISSSKNKYFYDFIQNSKLKLDYNVKTIKTFSKDINKISLELNEYLKSGKLIILSFKNRYKANDFIERLNNEDLIFTSLNELISKKINVIISPINEGYELENLVLITENELFNKNFVSNDIKYKNSLKYGTKVRDINKLNSGDYIVHQKHGIGRYCGLKTLTKNNLKKDYLMLEYKGGDKLYIPVEKIDTISKYSAKEGIAP